MIGKRFYKPLEENKIQREIVVTDEDGNEHIEVEYIDNPSENTYAKYIETANWCNSTQLGRIVDSGDYYEVEAIPAPTPEELAEALYRQYQAIIQNKLDSEAIKLGYDNADRVVARQNSTNPRYRAEGIAFNVWYDELWGFGNDLLNKVMAGEAEIPTPEDFEAMLPKLVIEYPAEVSDGAATDE